MTVGIYAIKNKLLNRYYIGSSIDVDNRMKSHFYGLDINKHHNSEMQIDFNNYGAAIFESIVLLLCEENELIEKEQYFIDVIPSVYNKRSSCIGSTARNKIKKEYCNMRLEPELIDRLKKEAKRRNRSVTNLVETWIKEKLDLL